MEAILDIRTEEPKGSFESVTYPSADADSILLLAGLRATVRDLLLSENGVGVERTGQMYEDYVKCNN